MQLEDFDRIPLHSQMQLSLKEDVSKNLGSFRGSGNFLLGMYFLPKDKPMGRLPKNFLPMDEPKGKRPMSIKEVLLCFS